MSLCVFNDRMEAFRHLPNWLEAQWIGSKRCSSKCFFNLEYSCVSKRIMPKKQIIYDEDIELRLKGSSSLKNT